jgi:LPS-assembly protein
VDRLLVLLAAGLLAQPGATAPAGASLPGPAGPVEVDAGSIRYDATAGRYLLSDGVVLRRGTTTVRARAATWDPGRGEIEATGDVLLFSPGRAVAADGMHLVLDGPFEAQEVVAFFKGAPLDLSGCTDIGEAERRERNRLSMRAARVEGEGDHFTAESSRLSLCDCRGGAPSWEIRATKADVIPGDRAILTWPVLYVTPRFLFIDKPVPILPLPWLQLPLSGRQTGLLVPGVNVGSVTGWALTQPVYFTLGRSFDATVSVDYAFGPGGVETSPGTDIPVNKRAVKGPGSSLEVRWAPLEGTDGQAKVYALLDQYRYPGGPSNGLRLALTARHDQQLTERTFLHLDAALVNDPLYSQDFVGDVLLRNPEYLRSSLALTHRLDDVLLELDAAYHEQISTLGQWQAGVPVVPFGIFGGSIPSFQRMPALSATLLPVRLAGPLLLSGSLGLARFGPFSGITDQSVNGLGPGERGWTGPAPVPGDAWAPGQRLTASRLAGAAELRAPFSIGTAVSLEPWARGSAAGYLFGDGAVPAQADGWASTGISASTRISRTFGEGPKRLRHDIEPRVEYRWGTGLAGPSPPAYAYDERDVAPTLSGAPCLAPPAGVSGGCLPMRTLSATPGGAWSQLRVALRNRLIVPSGKLSATALDVDLGQDFDLLAHKLAETWVRGSLSMGPVSAGLLARFFAFGASPPPGNWTAQFGSWLDAFTELRFDLSVSDHRGDNLHFGFLALGSGASGALRAGLEPLFDDRAVPFQAMAQGTGGVRIRVAGGLDATYDALFSARTVLAPTCKTGSPVEPVGPSLQQNTIGLIWNSPCQCWRAAVQVRISQCGSFGFGASIDLGELAGFRFSP